MSRAKEKAPRKKKVYFKVDQNKLDRASEVMRALAHPLRLTIIEFIDKNKVINVNKIYNTLKLEQSITSQHLKILRLAGLVKTRREGKFIFYSLEYKAIRQAVEAIEKHNA
jgi:DNA-binding transcriptional ArsR family regulator